MTLFCFKVVPYDCVWYTWINQILLSFAFPNLIRIMSCPFVSIRRSSDFQYFYSEWYLSKCHTKMFPLPKELRRWFGSVPPIEPTKMMCSTPFSLAANTIYNIQNYENLDDFFVVCVNDIYLSFTCIDLILLPDPINLVKHFPYKWVHIWL